MPASSSQAKARTFKTTAGNRPNNQQARYNQHIHQLHQASLAQQGMTFGPDGVPHIHAPQSNARPGPSAASAGFGSTPYTTGRNAGRHGTLSYGTNPAVPGGPHAAHTLPSGSGHGGSSVMAHPRLAAGFGGAALLAVTGLGYLFKQSEAEVERHRVESEKRRATELQKEFDKLSPKDRTELTKILGRAARG